MCDAAVFIGLLRKNEPELFASGGTVLESCSFRSGKRGRLEVLASGGRAFESPGQKKFLRILIGDKRKGFSLQ